MTDIPAELTAIHAALVEKIGCQPLIEPSLTILQSGKCSIFLYLGRDSNPYEGVVGTSPEKTLAAACAFIAALPNPETRAKQTWQGKLGKVIDEGHALNLPDEVMQPLRQGSQAMTENLLTGPTT